MALKEAEVARVGYGSRGLSAHELLDDIAVRQCL